MKTASSTSETLFWLHAGLILCAVALGLVLPLWVVVILVCLHRVHIMLFGGCLISLWERNIGGLRRHEDFFQAFCKRVFGVRISKTESRWISYAVALTPILLAIWRQALQNSTTS
jgi:uncharacterized RDD family membrane protein YckC